MRSTLRTCVTTDGTCEVRVNRSGKTVVSKGIPRYTTRTEIFRREHATRCHDTDKSVKCRLFRILYPCYS